MLAVPNQTTNVDGHVAPSRTPVRLRPPPPDFSMPERKFLERVHDRPDLDDQEIGRAWAYATQAHAGQKRKSGERFVLHPLRVAEILLELGLDDSVICAALLHDVVEDSGDPEYWHKKIAAEFRPEIIFLVDAVSKDARIEDSVDRLHEYCERLEGALHVHPGVFFLKMADLIHNLQTIKGLKPQKQEKWIGELRDCYLPMIARNFTYVPINYREAYLGLMDWLESVINNQSLD